MKYGKAVRKKVIGISKCDYDILMSHMIAFAQENNLRINYEPHVETYIEHDNDGYEHEFRFEPMRWMYNVTANLLRCGNKTKTLRILPPSVPAITIILTNNHERIEGTNEWVDQYQFFAFTSALQEREYRHKHWDSFSGYNTFDYDTDIEEIISSIKSSLRDVVDAYLPLFN